MKIAGGPVGEGQALLRVTIDTGRWGRWSDIQEEDGD